MSTPRVRAAITEETHIIIGHSMGSLIVYEGLGGVRLDALAGVEPRGPRP
jgi:alpha-beta hydrolase superfamily lysophospholipase